MLPALGDPPAPCRRNRQKRPRGPRDQRPRGPQVPAVQTTLDVTGPTIPRYGKPLGFKALRTLGPWVQGIRMSAARTALSKGRGSIVPPRGRDLPPMANGCHQSQWVAGWHGDLPDRGRCACDRATLFERGTRGRPRDTRGAGRSPVAGARPRAEVSAARTPNRLEVGGPLCRQGEQLCHTWEQDCRLSLSFATYRRGLPPIVEDCRMALNPAGARAVCTWT